MISVIIATKNGGRFITGAIESVQAQTYATDYSTKNTLEIIVVNDGSTDNLTSIVTDLQTKDSRIKLISLEKNVGPGLARDAGIKQAQGEYIAFIDDDDRWLSKDKLSIQKRLLDLQPDYAIVGASTIHIIDEQGKELRIHKNPVEYKKIYSQMLKRNCFALSSILMRKSVYEKVGGFKAMYLAEEYDLWLRIGLTEKFTNEDNCDIAYMLRSGSASTTRKREMYYTILKLVKEYSESYPGFLIALCRAYGRILVVNIQDFL